MPETNSQFATNQQDAAAAISVSEEEWNLLKEQADFPPRDPKRGWDITAIRAWLAETTSATPVADESATADLPSSTVNGGPKKTIEVLPQIATATITVPLCNPDPASYIATQQGRLNCRLSSPEQIDNFRRLHAALHTTHATLKSGQHVDGAPDVIRWLLENITL